MTVPWAERPPVTRRGTRQGAPGNRPTRGEVMRYNRIFIRRAVKYLVGQRGVRQIIDLGCGYSDSPDVFAIAKSVTSAMRVVAKDNDSKVASHAWVHFRAHGVRSMGRLAQHRRAGRVDRPAPTHRHHRRRSDAPRRLRRGRLRATTARKPAGAWDLARAAPCPRRRSRPGQESLECQRLHQQHPGVDCCLRTMEPTRAMLGSGWQLQEAGKTFAVLPDRPARLRPWVRRLIAAASLPRHGPGFSYEAETDTAMSSPALARWASSFGPVSRAPFAHS